MSKVTCPVPEVDEAEAGWVIPLSEASSNRNSNLLHIHLQAAKGAAPFGNSRPTPTGHATDLITFAPIAAVDASDVERLLDLAFGKDRHRRTAYRLREGVEALPGLSFAALEDGALVGSIQCWPIQLTENDGRATPLILVGPVAVQPDHQRAGVGRSLMELALAEADATASEPMMLIGDAAYYERFFDFSSRHTSGWTVPGPVDRDRLLARLRPGQVVSAHGTLGPRVAALVPGAD